MMVNGTSHKTDIPGSRLYQTSTESVRVPTLPGVGTFFMRGAHFEIPKGWKMVWKTQTLN
jgi:hypothetical protein